MINGVINIQAEGYNGACTVPYLFNDFSFCRFCGGILVFLVKSQCAVLDSYILFSTWQMSFSCLVFLGKNLEYMQHSHSKAFVKVQKMCREIKGVRK